MATPPSFTYSGVVYVATGSQTEFALTSTSGKAIGYLLSDHISVSTSADEGENWTKLNTPADYSFSTQGTRVVLTAAPTVDTWVLLKRTTPKDENWVDYQAGNLLTAGQLNEFESWQLYIDQELDDEIDYTRGEVNDSIDDLKTELNDKIDDVESNLQDQIDVIDGSTPGSAVKGVTGTAPITVNNTNDQTPVVGIDESTSSDDPNALTSDTRVMSEKAIDEAFKQYVGTGPASTQKTGQFRIDNSGASPQLFYWDGSAWVQMQTKGDTGDPGAIGPPPGLQDPAATATTIPTKPDGSIGDAVALVSQDPETMALQFSFGVPHGIQGPEGPVSTTPGPPPGLQDPATVVNNVPNNPDGSPGDATVSIAQDGSGDLQFSFGVPVGIQGIQGEKGEKGDAGTGVTYKGSIDVTTASPPANPDSGDFYVNTVTGSTSWPGLGGTVVENERIIWNDTNSTWDGYEPAAAERIDLSYSAAADKGVVLNSGGSDATVPLVTSSNAGLMSPAEHSKLIGIQAGAQVNPDLSNYMQQGQNVSLLNNDAGYITSADVPSVPVTSVNDKTGDVYLGLQEITDQGNTTTKSIFIGNGPKIQLNAGDGSASFSAGVTTHGFNSTNGIATSPGVYINNDSGTPDQLNSALLISNSAGEGTVDIKSEGSAKFSSVESNIELNNDYGLQVYKKTTDVNAIGFGLFSNIGGTGEQKIAFKADGSGSFSGDVDVRQLDVGTPVHDAVAGVNNSSFRRSHSSLNLDCLVRLPLVTDPASPTGQSILTASTNGTQVFNVGTDGSASFAAGKITLQTSGKIETVGNTSAVHIGLDKDADKVPFNIYDTSDSNQSLARIAGDGSAEFASGEFSVLASGSIRTNSQIYISDKTTLSSNGDAEFAGTITAGGYRIDQLTTLP